MSDAIDDKDSVIRRIGDSDDVGENRHIPAIPPRNIICFDIFFTASDSHKVKIYFMAFLYLSGIVDKDKLVDNGQGQKFLVFRIYFLL